MNVGYKVFQNDLNCKRICTVEVQYAEILKKGPYLSTTKIVIIRYYLMYTLIKF